MKAAFFSLFALATSVFAAPAPDTDARLRARSANDIHERSVSAETLINLDKRSVSTSAELIIVLETCNTGITPQCNRVGDLIAQYKSGAINKTECATESVSCFKECISILNVVISKCTGSGLLTVTASEISIIAQLVITIVTKLLQTIASCVTVCGLLSNIIAVLQALITVICTLLTLVCGLVPAIIITVVAALTALVGTLSVLGVYLLPLTACLLGL